MMPSKVGLELQLGLHMSHQKDGRILAVQARTVLKDKQNLLMTHPRWQVCVPLLLDGSLTQLQSVIDLVPHASFRQRPGQHTSAMITYHGRNVLQPAFSKLKCHACR